MTHPRDEIGSYDDIAAAAVRTTSLDDFGGTAHEEGLRLLVDDLASPEAGLTPLGNGFHRREVKSALVGRLLTQLRFTEHPEHVDVPVERPIFVVGLPRTGTTALHRLLHADPRHQGLELWLTEYPQPRPPRRDLGAGPDLLRDAGGVLRASRREPRVHGDPLHGCDVGRGVLAAAAADREVDQLRVVGPRPSLLGLAGRAGLGRRIRAPSRNLQLIGLNDPEKRWVLKNPSHLVALDSLMKVYPDALVVCTHRDPVASIASACSLSAEATAGTSTTFVGETIGRTQLEMLSRSWRTFVSSRWAYDPAQFVDVEYDDFVADPVRTTRHIYDAFGLDWTPEVDAAVTALDAESRSGGRRPKHAYSLDDYGLTEAEVRAAF